MEYEVTIGLEVHAELKTMSKMFCSSSNNPESAANTNICPVCMAHPGTLPVINSEAVMSVLRVGTAIGSKLADYTEFDRKNYFYPDLPKGYQISQFEFPLVSGGALNGVAITRIHLEEDTASSIHDDATKTTLIDYNRAGVPLMELVTEPVMHTAEEAGNFGRALQTLLRYLDVSEANMEKGEMRVEANISVAPRGERSAAYVEVKNLNSFRTMERAIAYEIKRQTTLLEKGEKLIKQTLGWDEKRQATFPQRTKEGSADYRYFPDPELPSLKLSELPEFDQDAIRNTLPELPWARKSRYLGVGVSEQDAESFVKNRILGDFFDVVTHQAPTKVFTQLAANYIANDLVKIIRDISTRDTEEIESIPIESIRFKNIIQMLESKKLSSRGAKDLLARCIELQDDPETIAKTEGLLQEYTHEQLAVAVENVLQAHQGVVAEYRAGKGAALQFLLGQVMRSLKGADPVAIRELLQKSLDSK